MGWPTDADIERDRIYRTERVGLEDECPTCGGDGIVDDGSCMCGDDTCCCAEPESPECRTCGGYGYIRKKEQTSTQSESK